MRKIPLSKGLFALVSPEDFERVNKFKWYASNESAKKSKWYAIRFETVRKGKREKIRMHRFIMGLHAFDKRVVDHLDGDTLDNRRENLEVLENQTENLKRAKGWRSSRVYEKKEIMVNRIYDRHHPDKITEAINYLFRTQRSLSTFTTVQVTVIESYLNHHTGGELSQVDLSCSTSASRPANGV